MKISVSKIRIGLLAACFVLASGMAAMAYPPGGPGFYHHWGGHPWLTFGIFAPPVVVAAPLLPPVVVAPRPVYAPAPVYAPPVPLNVGPPAPQYLAPAPAYGAPGYGAPGYGAPGPNYNYYRY